MIDPSAFAGYLKIVSGCCLEGKKGLLDGKFRMGESSANLSTAL
jgi:hypothetical protein